MTRLAIVQARTSSTRLPGKVLIPVVGEPMILRQLRRIGRSQRVDLTVLATSVDKTDDNLAELVSRAGFRVFRGELNDVLKRFCDCASSEGASSVIRLTGDCPLTDPVLIDEIIDAFELGNWDYLANCADAGQLSVPNGFDIEVFRADLLIRASQEARLPSQREHVTPWFRSHEAGLHWGHFRHQPIRSYFRVTVDHPQDLEVVQTIVAALEPRNPDFGVDDVVAYLEQHPEVAARNLATVRNEGYLKSLAEDAAQTGALHGGNPETLGLWQRAKRVLPSTSMPLSHPGQRVVQASQWPVYFTRTKGCRIWDLDGRELIDVSSMGFGANLLGYSHPEVDAAVAATVAAGNTSTLNGPEEVWLAEHLVALHPWAEMAQFFRSEREAAETAINNARVATGRQSIAICGNLAGQHGALVPNALRFEFERLDQLDGLAANEALAAVVIVMQGSDGQTTNFLRDVRDLCRRRGIVLILDECRSSFRENFGGLHMKYGIEPDMAVFGRTLGNGYPIAGTVGLRAVMDLARSTSISDAFWSERIGPSAALKSLEVMERERSWERITATGTAVRRSWQRLADRHHLNITHHGVAALSSFSINGQDSSMYAALITQEMLKRGYLADTSCSACLAHTPEIIQPYVEALDIVFTKIAECEAGKPVEELLGEPIWRASSAG